MLIISNLAAIRYSGTDVPAILTPIYDIAETTASCEGGGMWLTIERRQKEELEFPIKVPPEIDPTTAMRMILGQKSGCATIGKPSMTIIFLASWPPLCRKIIAQKTYWIYHNRKFRPSPPTPVTLFRPFGGQTIVKGISTVLLIVAIIYIIFWKKITRALCNRSEAQSPPNPK